MPCGETRGSANKVRAAELVTLSPRWQARLDVVAQHLAVAFEAALAKALRALAAPGHSCWLRAGWRWGGGGRRVVL